MIPSDESKAAILDHMTYMYAHTQVLDYCNDDESDDYVHCIHICYR